MIKFVYFDVGGTVIKDFNGTNNNEHDLEICSNKFPVKFSTVLELVKGYKKNKSIWPVIQETIKHCPVGLLTNMYPGMLTEIKKQELLPQMKWNVIVDSSLESFAKPGKEIYEIAQEKAGVNTNEILFIDNTPVNIETARSFGWQTFLYDSKDYELSSKNLLEYIQHEFTK